MSEKPKNLRHYLSKSKVSQPKENVEHQKELSLNKENIENNKDKDNAIETDIDPLKFFEQPKEQVAINPQISFLDLITNVMEEKKEAERAKEEELRKEQDIEEENDENIPVSIIARVQSRRKPEENKEPIKLIDKEPTKLLGSLNKKIDENELLKQLEKEKLDEELKDEPQQYEKLDLPELDENKKKRLMARMTSAKQGVNKFVLGKALLQMASAGLIERNGKDDDGALKKIHQIVTTDLKNTFVLNDPDVQRVTDNEPNKGIEVKKIDFSAFMNAKTQDPKKEKKSIKDILLGKTKPNPQAQQQPKDQPK